MDSKAGTGVHLRAIQRTPSQAGYQYPGDGTHIVTVQGIFTHEDQNLKGTTAAFNMANETSLSSTSSLNQIRLNASYWYQNTYGVTLGWQKTWGPASLQSPSIINEHHLALANWNLHNRTQTTGAFQI